MKKLFLIALLLPVLISCEASLFQMDSLDATTKLHVKGDGLKCKDVTLQINGKEIRRNEFYQGESVWFVFEHLQGLQRKNERAYADMSMKIMNDKGDIVYEEKNMLGDKGIKDYPIKIMTSIETAVDKSMGENFEIAIKIKDRNGNGTLIAEMPFKVVENPNLKVHTKNVDYNMIRFWDEEEQMVVSSQDVDAGKDYSLLFNDIQGIDQPVVSLEIVDAEGNSVHKTEDIFDAFTIEERKKTMAQFPARFTLGNGLKNPLIVKCHIHDALSENYLKVSTEVNVK